MQMTQKWETTRQENWSKETLILQEPKNGSFDFNFRVEEKPQVDLFVLAKKGQVSSGNKLKTVTF